MDHSLPDCCQLELTGIYLLNIAGNNPPLEPKSVFIHHSQILSLQGTSLPPTGNIFGLQEPLNKSVFLTMIVQTLLIRVNYTRFLLKNTSWVVLVQSALFTTLFNSSCLSALPYCTSRDLAHLKSHKKSCFIYNIFIIVLYPRKADAFIVTAHVEHQFLGFVLIFSKSLITCPQYKYNSSVIVLKIHMQNVKILAPPPVSQNKLQCIFKSERLTFL